LVHGFGFANTLLELELPTASLVTALIGFNLGVEVGQLAVVAAILALAQRSRGGARSCDRELLDDLASACAIALAVPQIRSVCLC
jgi:hypothetical protein